MRKMGRLMNRKKLPLTVLALLALAGCNTTQPIAMSVSAVPTDPSVTNGDVLAQRRAAGEDIPSLRGTEVVTIRTFRYVKGDNGGPKREELTGVSCALTGEGYAAQVTTPGQVRVPDYGYATRPVEVQCNAEGYKPGIGNIKPFDGTKAARVNAGSGAGLVGVIGMGIINAADSDKDNDFVYPPVNIIINTLDCDTSQFGCRSR